jgi:hypothetical protein
LGTHFFQDLMGAQIYTLAVNLDEPDAIFQHVFFYETPNHLLDWANCDRSFCQVVRLIDVADYRRGHHLELAMDDEAGLAVAYLSPDDR